jgi:hypothetical protein
MSSLFCFILPIPVSAPSKAWIWSRSLACWDCGFKSCRGHGCLSLASVVCCQVEVSVSVWSLVQRCPTECGVSECDREALTMRRVWPTSGCCTMAKKSFIVTVTRHLVHTPTYLYLYSIILLGG